jgi:hypothetical protein
MLRREQVRQQVEIRSQKFGREAKVPANEAVEHMGMRSADSIARYKLVPEPGQGETAGLNGSAPPAIRRYRLARVGVARRSELGIDRHERLEEIAAREQRR